MKSSITYVAICIFGVIGLAVAHEHLNSPQNDAIEVVQDAEGISFGGLDIIVEDYFVATNLSIGCIEIDLGTGNVEITDANLNSASREFWRYIEEYFKKDAKLALRLELFQEIASESRVMAHH